MYSCSFLITDINECEAHTYACHPEHEYCLNREGGFDCKCKLGFVLSDDGSCIGKFGKLYSGNGFCVDQAIFDVNLFLRCEYRFE